MCQAQFQFTFLFSQHLYDLGTLFLKRKRKRALLNIFYIPEKSPVLSVELNAF